MPRLRSVLPLVAALALGATGCIHKGFFGDGTSLSLGRSNRGVLIHGRALPPWGPGYLVPPTWLARDSRWAIDELVEAIQRAAARVEERMPGGLLGVGDLSTRGGGRAIHHKSHENGRDADLIFYAVDANGAPLPPADGMPRYDRHLRSHAPFDGSPTPISPRLFDVPRNWALVAALLDDPEIDVEYLFISNPLRDKLLEYAWQSGERPELIAKARVALRSPGRRALPHDDHLHLRVRCPESDKALGCVDEGNVRLRVERVKGPPLG